MADAARLTALIPLVEREFDLLQTVRVHGPDRRDVDATWRSIRADVRDRLSRAGAYFSESIGGTEICLGGLSTRGATGLAQALASWIHFARNFAVTPVPRKEPIMNFDAIEPGALPTPVQTFAAHRGWAEFLLAKGLTTPSRADVMVKAAEGLKPGEKTPYFGMIAAAYLLALGATPSATPPSRWAILIATALRNAEFDIARAPMRASDLPFDALVEPDEPYLRALVQGLLDGAPVNAASGETRPDAIAAASRLAREKTATEAGDIVIDALRAIRAL